MSQGTSRNTIRIFFVVGLLLVFTGIICNRELIITQASSLFGIRLGLGGLEGTARLWILKITFIVIGLPLLLYKFRSHQKFGVLFDISMGFVFLLTTLFFIEGLFYILNTSNPSSPPPQRQLKESEAYVNVDELLGYKLKPDVQASVVQMENNQVIYDVVYSIDEYGRRITPVDNPEKRDKFILFLGGSFTFGDGVHSNETLPAYVGQFAPEYKPYNYGVPGYGTQQVLAKLDSGEVVSGVQEEQGIAVYNFICSHIKRVIGSMDVHNVWGEHMPYYTLNSNDKLIRKGDLVSGRPTLSVIYAIMSISHTAKYFNITLPRLNDSHIAFTARVIEESAKAFKRDFNSDAFYVLIYPPASCAPTLISYLEEVHIKYLDYGTLLDGDDDRVWQPDRHPTALGHKIVAEKTAVDLGIIGSKTDD